MNELFATICALATPQGQGAIAVTRVSGKETFAILDKIFRGKRSPSKLPANHIEKGEIIDPDKDKDELIDEVLIATYHAPNSYTGEDMVEIFSHGGSICAERIISLLCRYGCRRAYPGEFTKRRFLAGKISLPQAEALLFLTQARSELQARVALKQMQGEFTKRIREIGLAIKELLALVENKIEFEEEGTTQEFLPTLAELQRRISELIKKGEKEHYIRDGINCVIVGKTNVGKSSLFNRLLKKERALVTSIPGTTRDAIEETVVLDGLVFRLIDTAGLRIKKGKIEALGWEKTKDYLTNADFVIVVLDNSRSLTEKDWEIIEATQNQRRVLVRNKMDLRSKWNNCPLPSNPLPISCKEGTGIEELKGYLAREFGNQESDFYVSEFRYGELLRKAAERLTSAAQANYLEVLADELKKALLALQEITGEVTSEEILDRIFSRFCIGK